MMQAIRNISKPFILIVTVTFLAWMVLELSGITGGGGIFTQTSVGSINGQSVDRLAYEQAVQNAISEQTANGGGALGMDATEKVRNDVWEQFIQTSVMNAEYKRRHLTASTEEIADAIRYNPPPQFASEPSFQTQGKFDIQKYQMWLGSAAAEQLIPMLEAEYRDRILQSKLYRVVVADVFLSDAALWDRFKYSSEAVKINMTAIITRNAVPDSAVSVTTAEVEEYYKTHQEVLRRARTAFLSYVAVPRRIDASDSAASLAHANQVRNEITAGAPFADVAKRESADVGTAANGGEMGTFAKGSQPEAIQKVIMSIPLKTLSQPILNIDGYHLFEVTKRAGDSVTARHILIPIALAGAHRDLVDAQTDTLERIAADQLDPSTLDTVSKVLHLPIGKAQPAQEGTPVTVGPMIFPDAAVWAFRAKQGETSPIIEGEDAYYVFRVDSTQQAGVPPLDQVRPAVEELVREGKKEERAAAIGAELIKRLQAGASLADASKALNLPNKDFGPFTRRQPPVPSPLLIGAAFGLAKGARSELITTSQGRYVLQVLDHTTPDSTLWHAGLDKYRSEQINMARQDRVREFQKELRDAAKIKDDRASLFNTTAAQANASAAGKKKPS